MNDASKSKKQLLEEIADLRQQIKALKTIPPTETCSTELLAALSDFLFQISPDGRYLAYHTTNFHSLYRPDDSRLGKHILEVLPSEASQSIMDALQKTITSGMIQSVEYQLACNHTTCFFVCHLVNYGDGSILAIVRDISELKYLQQELSRLDQLHLAGEIAASVGHEVRNPLTTIRGVLQLLSGKSEYSPIKKYFTLMIEEIDRANSILSEFLSLSKNKSMQSERQNLNHIIRNISPLLTCSATISNHSLELKLTEIPDLLLNGQEIRQLILNLVRNGLEAMPPNTVMKIKTFMEGNKVVLAVEDKGTGIAPEVLKKIGRPFFTTKENGTGLGLAMCYHIAAKHNALIEVHTSSKGTTFLIKFDQ